MIEIRKVHTGQKIFDEEGVHAELGRDGVGIGDLGDMGVAEIGPPCLSSVELQSAVQKIDHAPQMLVGVVKDGEKFDFCMCNPPFFETMEEAGLNPKTACGGTKEEMACPGGEQGFITRIIEDSVQLKQSFRYIFRILLESYLESYLWSWFIVEYFSFDSIDSVTSLLIVGGTLQWLEGNQI